MGHGQALAAVLPGDADPGQAAVEEHALQLAAAGDPGQLLLVGAERADHAAVPVSCGRGGMLAASHVRARWVKVSTSSMSVVIAHQSAFLRLEEVGDAGRMLRRGHRRVGASVVTRRRNRCRSWSKVTPMPPWSCTQSCISSGP